MGRAPVVVHRPSQTGGRRVTARRHGREEILGLTRLTTTWSSSWKWVEYPTRMELDDPRWVEWRGGRPHQRSIA